MTRQSQKGSSKSTQSTTPLKSSPYFAKRGRPSTIIKKQSSRKNLSTPESAVTASAATNEPRRPKKTSASKRKTVANVPRTESFEPVWAGNRPGSSVDTNVEIHTLVLGTHPSIKSLSAEEYFGHDQNAYWWIAGDCLGFRRKEGRKKAGGFYKFTDKLRYDENNVIPYDEQVNLFTSKGFALWDIVRSCVRPGSLDSDIRQAVPNNIREFCQCHKSIKRIVLANGSTGSKEFVKHFQDWWKSGELKPASNKESQTAFKRFAKHTNNFENATISVISAVSVSPAAAMYSYEEKRGFWEEHVYNPGLQDFEQNL